MAVLAILCLVLLAMNSAESSDDTQIQEPVEKHGEGFSIYLMKQVFKLEGLVQEMKTTQLKKIEDGIEKLQSSTNSCKEARDFEEMQMENAEMKSMIEKLSEEIEKLKGLNLDTELLKLQENVLAVQQSNSALQLSNTELQKEVIRFRSSKKLGSTYVRWGRTSCPTGREKVYKGYVGGSHYSHSGGAANYICLPDDPQFGYSNDAGGAYAKVYGTEYQFNSASSGANSYFGENLYDFNAPCAVCRSSRPSTIMIPSRKACYPGWTIEYSGYLVAGRYNHVAPSEYVCLDRRAETIGSANDENGKLFYLTEGVCGSLPCPPYVNGRELTCVVCSK